MKTEWEEQRAVRDALFAEKWKRMEKMKQTQKASEGQANDQSRISQTLESLYKAAGVPNETPSRQQLLQRVKLMSPEEIYFLNAELRNIQKRFNETGDQKDLDASLFDLTTKKLTKDEVSRKINQQDQKRLEEIRQSLSLDIQDSFEKQEAPEEIYKKYQNFEAHKDSAERSIKALQEIKNNFEKSNDIAGALMLLEVTLTNLTLNADYEDILQLRGKPVDIQGEKIKFKIDDDHLDDYIRIREAQNTMLEEKSVKEAVNILEDQLSGAYGIRQINLNGINTIRELNALKVDVDLFPEITNNPEFNGKIKEVLGIGYQIPNVPLYNAKGEQIGEFNKSVNAKPKIVFYRSG
jgi:hypothetical protein